MDGLKNQRLNQKSRRLMERLIERLNELSGANFSGTVTLSYYKGSLSKKIKIEVTENLKLDESLSETTGTNSKEKS